MRRIGTTIVMLTLAAAGSLCAASLLLAQESAEPKQAPAAPAPAEPKKAPEQPAAGQQSSDKPAPKPAPRKNAKDSKDAKGEPQGKGQSALIAPPGLLSRVLPLPPSTAPGLGKLDLNRASLEQLQRLPGVGLTWAPRILAGRPYRTFGDLARDGIPYTTIERLSREVVLGP